MELHGTGHGGSWMLQQMEGEACSYMRQGMGELDGCYTGQGMEMELQQEGEAGTGHGGSWMLQQMEGEAWSYIGGCYSRWHGGGSWMLQQMEGEAWSYTGQGMGGVGCYSRWRVRHGVTQDRAWGELDVTTDGG